MSSTRHAKDDANPRQERYCSSAEFERGLMANLVAKRCDVLADPADRELIYFLQHHSHQEGGLKALAEELAQTLPERIGTAEMHQLGFQAGRVYSRNEALAVRGEMNRYHRGLGEELLLRGERGYVEIISDYETDGERGRFERGEIKRAALRPDCLPAETFHAICLKALATDGGRELEQLCLDPGFGQDLGCDPWYCADLAGTLREFMERKRLAAEQSAVVTQLGALVHETLDYALQGRCMTIVDGLARTGKTVAAKAWCAARPGRARYVQVPSTNDDIGFYRAIAKSLGVSTNLNLKAQQLRDRIEDVLQRGHLMLVLDEAHYLWPQTNYRDAIPARITWLMTALVNHGVPVSLVTTPQFIATQKAVEKRTSWTSEQFIGRIGHYQKLPDSLPEADLAAVAKALLPEGDERCIGALVNYAKGSAKYLAGIESVVRRARFLAGKESRKLVEAGDIRRAIKEGVIPSDSALAAALQEPPKHGRKGSRTVPAPALQDRCTEDASTMEAVPIRTGSRISAGEMPAVVKRESLSGVEAPGLLAEA